MDPPRSSGGPNDAIRHHRDFRRPAYILALAYCKILHGETCWQWQAANSGERVQADALIEEARSKPRYITELAMGAGA
jgi:hypothetical protein